jgi:hypothetical protein
MIAQARTSTIVVALLALLAIVVCFRSWVFVWFPHAHFDSDQAVFGLMAKDFIEGRAIPVFTYGRGYMLAVSVWLTAPLLALLGPSMLALKAPMLAMNLGVVAMLWVGLRRDGLSPWGTALAIAPFAAPSVITSSRLVEHAGGNIEPFPFILGAFFLRDRPILYGLLMSVAFLNREFAMIGFIALLMVDVVEGQLRDRWKTRLTGLGVMLFSTWLIRALAKRYTAFDGGGPGAIGAPSLDNIIGFFKVQLPSLIGGASGPIRQYNITSDLVLGHAAVYWALGAWCILLLASLAWTRPRRADLSPFSTYLILVGGGQALAFMLFANLPYDMTLVRYVLLLVFALVGLVALAWQRPALRLATAVTIGLITCLNLWDGARLVAEYRRQPPKHENEVLAEELRKRNIRYAVAEYWVAFDVSWLTYEQVIASPRSDARIPRYIQQFEQHASELIEISREPCRDGEKVLSFYLCKPSPKNNKPERI